MLRNKILCIVILSIFTLSLQSCSLFQKKPDEGFVQDSPKPKEVKESTTINIWIMPNSQDASDDFIKVMKPFKEKNPNIDVKVTVLNWETAWDKIVSAATGTSEAPDITQLGTTWVAAVSSLGALTDLTGKYNKGDFLDQTLLTTSIAKDSKITAIPWFAETRALFYRMDACKKAGVNPESDFDTWDSFKLSLKKLNKIEMDGKKLSSMGMPGKNDWNVPHNFSIWVYGAGGDFLDADNTKVTINSENALQGIEFYTQLARDGLIDKVALDSNTSDVENGFLDGKFATSIMGCWTIGQLEKNKTEKQNNFIDQVGVAMIPEGPKGRFAFLGGSTLTVFESSKHKKEAIEVLNFLTSKEAQIAYAKCTGNLPTVKSAYDDPFISEDRLRSVFKKQMSFAKGYPSIPEWGPAESLFKTGIVKIWDNVLEVNGPYDPKLTKAAIDEVAVEVEKEMKNSKK